jgi:chorismate mutase
MDTKSSYLLVDTSVAPEVFVKVVKAKKYLDSGKCETINEAIARANISRSAFYKYKNYVFPYSELNKEKIVTLFFILDDVSGILSNILHVLAQYQTNVLTINQNIPVNNLANITISFRMGKGRMDIDGLIEEMKNIEGINKIELLSME